MDREVLWTARGCFDCDLVPERGERAVEPVVPVEVLLVGWAVGSAPTPKSPTTPPHHPAARSSLSSPRRLIPLPTGASLRFELLIARVLGGTTADAGACEAQGEAEASNEARVQYIEQEVDDAGEEGPPIEKAEDRHQRFHAVDKTRRQDGRVGGGWRRG